MARSPFAAAHALNLLHDLRRANTESAKKERLVQYLTATFSNDETVQRLITDMALGAERTVSNIPRGAAIGRGRADTQTETIIIEWENDLARTGEHAREQLEEYLLGNWRSGQTYRFVLVTTDGIRWRRYAPNWSAMPIDAAGRLKSIELRETAKFDLKEDTTPEFPFFLDELLFGNQQRPATLKRIQDDFGDTSSAFINSIDTLRTVAGDINGDPELAVAFAQWRRFLSIAYGAFDSSPSMFLVHTYLSVFAKMIAHAVVTGRSTPDEIAVRGVLDGSAFRSMNIERFVEDDFFHWVHGDAHFGRLRPMFREIARRIQEYDFSAVSEDILKGVYQELIDLDTRHALGEYYTPDWLCEQVVDAVPMQASSSVLDPACGSGSFLRAAVARIRREDPSRTAQEIAAQVAGIDIHPLSVQISKTTLLLALGDLVRQAAQPIVLQVFLANSLLVPRGTANLFQSNFEISVDNAQYTLDVSGLEGGEAFDELISLCDTLVERSVDTLPRDRFLTLARNNIPKGTSPSLPGQLYDIYHAMKRARDAGRDSIWKFILQNSYKPVFLMKRFDVIVGNPPWLTYADVGSAEYQELLKRLADVYGVTPVNKKNMPHLEIAAIFLAHSVNYFLNEAGGVVAFVLPRSFMSADQHHNARAGLIEGMRVAELWDLRGVTPLFRVPSCVLFARREDRKAKRPIGDKGLAGRRLSGTLPREHVRRAESDRCLTNVAQRWHYSTLQATASAKRVRSAFTKERLVAGPGANAYFDDFKQGATIVPRNFYLVEVEQELPAGTDLSNRVTAVRTSDASDSEAKGDWKGKTLKGRVEGDLLFRTAISRNVVPFSLVAPVLVTLPVTVERKKGRDEFLVRTADELFESGFRHGSAWFNGAESAFEEHRSETYEKGGMTLQKRLDFQRGLTAQSPAARYLVLYTSSATDASAVVIDRDGSDLPFIVDHKTYWCEVVSREEGDYVAAFLNSGYANRKIKGFQSTGLFGERDIHKTIVMLAFPAFNRRDGTHKEIARVSAECAISARALVGRQGWTELGKHALGRARTRVREELADEMVEIDRLLAQAIEGAAPAKKIRRKTGQGKGTLL